MPVQRPEGSRTSGFLPAMLGMALLIGVIVVTLLGRW